MAFNPFHGFRKHQKVVFAMLTILCMLTFVLCSGMGGDLGERIMYLFGGRGGGMRGTAGTLGAAAGGGGVGEAGGEGSGM